MTTTWVDELAVDAPDVVGGLARDRGGAVPHRPARSPPAGRRRVGAGDRRPARGHGRRARRDRRRRCPTRRSRLPGGEADWTVAEAIGHTAAARAGLVLAASLAAAGRWPADAPTRRSRHPGRDRSGPARPDPEDPAEPADRSPARRGRSPATRRTRARSTIRSSAGCAAGSGSCSPACTSDAPGAAPRDRRWPAPVARGSRRPSALESGPPPPGGPSVLDQTASPSANRRVFRSKVDDLRPTYGFEDVSLAPGTDTIEPADVELGQVFCGIELGDPDPRRRRWTPSSIPRSPGALAGARRPRDPQPRGRPDPLRRPGRDPRPDRGGARRRGPGRCSPRRTRQPIREELIARRIEEIHAAGLEGRGGGDARRRPSVRPVLRRARRGPVPRPEPGLERPPPRVRLRPALARGLHPVHADPGRGRQHDEQRGRVRADGAGRRRGLRRRRARAPPARPARSSGSASRRSPRSATSPRPATPTSPRPAATSRSSPTAGCAAAASWRRRSPPAPTS